MSYRNQELPEIPSRPSNQDEGRWAFVRGIQLNCVHLGDNQGRCLDGHIILSIIDLMDMWSSCRRLVIFDLPHGRSVFKPTQKTYGDTCTIINNQCRSNDK